MFICIWILVMDLLPGSLACPPAKDYEEIYSHDNNTITDIDAPVWLSWSRDGVQHTAPPQLQKRWNSLAGLDDNPPHRRGPWPQTHGSWSECDLSAPRQWIYYCFKDMASSDHLLWLVVYAIAHWSPASMLSALQIQPDPACQGQYVCICSGSTGAPLAQTAGDTLVISDRNADSNDHSLHPHSKLGYDYTKDQTGRHYMIFPMPQWPPTWGTPAYWGILMTHEFGITEQRRARGSMADNVSGHVIGLKHEHQRPDRDMFIDYDCTQLHGYGSAEAEVKAVDNPSVFPSTDIKDRMAKV